MKATIIFFWISTVVMCLIILFSAAMYFLNTGQVREYFQLLGYPDYLVYPLAIAKILAVVAILSNKSRTLKEWAYAGIFFDTGLAFTAHLITKDGGGLLAAIGIVTVLSSAILDKSIKR